LYEYTAISHFFVSIIIICIFAFFWGYDMFLSTYQSVITRGLRVASHRIPPMHVTIAQKYFRLVINLFALSSCDHLCTAAILACHAEPKSTSDDDRECEIAYGYDVWLVEAMLRVGGAVEKHPGDRAEITDSNLQSYAHGTLGLARDILGRPACGSRLTVSKRWRRGC